VSTQDGESDDKPRRMDRLRKIFSFFRHVFRLVKKSHCVFLFKKSSPPFFPFPIGSKRRNRSTGGQKESHSSFRCRRVLVSTTSVLICLFLCFHFSPPSFSSICPFDREHRLRFEKSQHIVEELSGRTAALTGVFLFSPLFFTRLFVLKCVLSSCRTHSGLCMLLDRYI